MTRQPPLHRRLLGLDVHTSYAELNPNWRTTRTIITQLLHRLTRTRAGHHTNPPTTLPQLPTHQPHPTPVGHTTHHHAAN